MSSSPHTPPVAPLWLAVFSLGVGAAAYLPTLGGGFLTDDFVYVSRFFTYAWSDWPRLFTREWSEGVWGFPLIELRPFSALAFMIDARLWGGEAAGYRVTNLLLHLGVVWLVLRLTWRYSGGHTLGTLAAALVFALHPAHTEPVVWITGRVDLLATFAALAFWSLAEAWSASGRGWRLGLALGGLFVGVFSKELCLFAPPLLLLRWLLVEARVDRAVWVRRGLILLGVVLIALLYTLARRAAFGDGAAVPASSWHQDDAWRRQVSYAAWLAPVLPFLQQFEIKTPVSPATLRALGVALVALTTIGLGVAAWRNHRRWGNLIFFTGFWWIATVGGLLLVGYFSARHLYFPTTGLAIGFGLAIAWLGPVVGRGVAVVVLIWLGAGHLMAVRPWLENGRISRQLLVTLQKEVPRLPVGAVAIINAHELRKNVFLWFWACPHALGVPFVSPPMAPDRVIMRGGLYYRPEKWEKDIHPLDVIQTATAALVVDMTEAGQVQSAVVSRADLAAHLPGLAARTNDADGIKSEELSSWVEDLLKARAPPSR